MFYHLQQLNSISSVTIRPHYLSWVFLLWQFDMNRYIQAKTWQDFFKLNLVGIWWWCLLSILIATLNISLTDFFSTSDSSMKYTSNYFLLVNSMLSCVVPSPAYMIIHLNVVYSATASPLFSNMMFCLVLVWAYLDALIITCIDSSAFSLPLFIWIQFRWGYFWMTSLQRGFGREIKFNLLTLLTLGCMVKLP